MIYRTLTQKLQDALRNHPAVALLGPRQSGKTTLALEVGKSFDARYLDLESEQDRTRLADPELYLSDQLERLVILDEVHRTPGLFPVLRGLIDRSRRTGRRSGLYLLLGSASLDLLKQTGESLAGRISYIELTPFTILEAGAANVGLL
ncbi:MAG: AAA family ATPase, partial [Chlorobi bacterium]|nr:AAA family ATPase [Chlorobiota bacterium]